MKLLQIIPAPPGLLAVVALRPGQCTALPVLLFGLYDLGGTTRVFPLTAPDLNGPAATPVATAEGFCGVATCKEEIDVVFAKYQP